MSQAAAGGPELRKAWERAEIRPTDLADRVGVTPRALRKWAADGSTTPPARVVNVAAALRDLARDRDQRRDDLLRVLTHTAATGRGMTRTELRSFRRRADTDRLLEELLDGALPMAHVRRTVVPGHRSREELHPGPPPPAAEKPDEAAIDPETLRGLRLYAGYSAEGMASRCGCRRQQLQAWETGRVPVPEGRREQVRRMLATAAEHGNRQLVDRLAAIDLKQVELGRRAGVQAFIVSNAHTGRGRQPTWTHLSKLGHTLDEAERTHRDDIAAGVDELVALVAAAEPHGLTAVQLERMRGRGRARGQTGASARDAKVLAAAKASRRVQWVEHHDAAGRGGRMLARRLHLPGYVPPDAALGAEELRRQLARTSVSASELGRAVGVSFGTAARWTRGERTISPHRVPAVRAAIEDLSARPRRDAAEDLRVAAHASPGLPRWQLLVAAGYGKSNRAAAAALDRLVAAGELHLQPRPHHSTVVYPGQSPADVPTRMSGDMLRRLRTAAGLRQRDLAAALGVNQTAVAGWERAGLPAERRRDVEPLLRISA